ncbi:hypothetical protein CLV63_10382 [Murinocardiopsis flavida]|uniref:Uncharacterized protein n=1 Tax=Murinocardiopsis flavida TaxID=645275 RepID=A0A2P8DQ55_9ACTN|nr:hypothetical protein [Murinocardiopsis flavida]PSK99359.1 hypothetical protein CLV63_10382 [Murinocardiopsis flavida]
MSTATHEVRRDSDGELVGYLRDTDGTGRMWQPLTVFDYPLGGAAEYVEAMTAVEDAGLDYLHGPWWFREDTGGAWYRCAIVEAARSRIKVQVTDPDYPHDSLYRTLDAPDPAVLRKTPPEGAGPATG